MEAYFKSLKLTPIKFDKEGDVSQPQMATFTVDIPMDSPIQHEKVQELLDLLSKEFIYIDVYKTRKPEEEG